MRGFIPALGLVLVSCCASSHSWAAPPDDARAADANNQPQPADAGADQRHQDWVSDLAAPEYNSRRDAFMSLWEQGSSALPAVRRAAGDADQQIAAAARVLELLLRLEISPKDNAELAELLQTSRVALHRAIMSLAEKGHWRLAEELLRSNESMLEAYRKSGRCEWLCMVVQSAYEQGDVRKAWPILQQLLSPVQAEWIAVQAGIPPQATAHKRDVDSQALAFLFRKEYDKAWQLQPSMAIQQRIIFLSGRWQWLQNDALRAAMGSAAGQTLEARAKQAAYAYLANEVQQSDETLQAVLKELAERGPASADQPPAEEEPKPALRRPVRAEDLLERRTQELIVALLICGQGDAVRELISQDKQRENLMYYGVRLEYDRALAAFGLSADLSGYDAWLDATMIALAPTLRKAGAGRGIDEFQQLCELSAFLVSMGKVQEGLRLYEKLMDATVAAPEAQRDESWSYLATQGRQTQFRSHLIRLLDKRDGDLSPEARNRFFTVLYPEWRTIASSLWNTAPPELVQRFAGQPPSSEASPTQEPQSETKPKPPSARRQARRWELMERLWRFDRELVNEYLSQALVENWLKSAHREASQIEDATVAATSASMSDIAMRLGLRASALSFAKAGKGRSALADVAEIYMHEKSFENASLLWEGAIRSDPWRHDWLLQNISALSMIGEQEKAQALEDSRWLRPLAVERPGAAYWTIAVNLQETGLTEQARDYAYAAFIQQAPDSPQFLSTTRTYAQILQDMDDFSTSADVHRAGNLMLLSQFNPGYPLATLQHIVSEEFLARALSEIDAGDIPSALNRIERFEQLRPSGIEICEHAYPRLVKRGAQADADRLLERCSSRMLKHLEQWPQDAGSHNNLAWMYARCERHLDEALKHAQLAVELSEDAPTYIDTLAETHFRLGHLDEALRLAEKCTALDPRHDHYQQQLQRFREARRAHSQ